MGDDKYVNMNEKKPSKAKWVIPLFMGAIGYGTYLYLNTEDQSQSAPLVDVMEQSVDDSSMLAKVEGSMPGIGLMA